MFKPPENMGTGEQLGDLDFTKPGAIPGIEVKEDFSTVEEKKKQLKETIQGFERIIQEKTDQPDLVSVAEARKKEFEETLAMLEQKPTEAKQEFLVEPAELLNHLSADDRKLDRKEKGLI